MSAKLLADIIKMKNVIIEQNILSSVKVPPLMRRHSDWRAKLHCSASKTATNCTINGTNGGTNSNTGRASNQSANASTAEGTADRASYRASCASTRSAVDIRKC
ncbi:MAG: hypothetical protein ACYCUX_11380 [Metallibacterium sp.]